MGKNGWDVDVIWNAEKRGYSLQRADGSFVFTVGRRVGRWATAEEARIYARARNLKLR